MTETYETGSDGILTEGCIIKVAALRRVPDRRQHPDHYHRIAFAQHQADIEKVKAIKNPYHKDTWADVMFDAFDEAIKAVLKAMGKKE